MNTTKILTWRVKHGWTQKRAAELLRMPLETYKKREQGNSRMPGVMQVAMDGLDLMHPAT
jgi:hypothetical protein